MLTFCLFFRILSHTKSYVLPVHFGCQVVPKQCPQRWESESTHCPTWLTAAGHCANVTRRCLWSRSAAHTDSCWSVTSCQLQVYKCLSGCNKAVTLVVNLHHRVVQLRLSFKSDNTHVYEIINIVKLAITWTELMCNVSQSSSHLHNATCSATARIPNMDSEPQTMNCCSRLYGVCSTDINYRPVCCFVYSSDVLITN